MLSQLFLSCWFKLFVVAVILTGTDAFMMHHQNHHGHGMSSVTKLYSTSPTTGSTSPTATIFSGEVAQEATKRLNHYNIIAQSLVYTPGSGRPVVMKDLLSLSSSSSSSTTNTNIVVFLRSLG